MAGRCPLRTLKALLAAILIIPASAAPPPAAEVTFYSGGNIAANFAPYANHAVFIGFLYVGDQQIGFVQPKRFLTLHLPTGPQIFSASQNKKHPAKNSQLPLVLTEGGKYFVRVEQESRLISSDVGRLDLVTCKTAHQEAGNASPTDSKRIVPEMRDKITSARSMPPCE